MFEFLFHLLCTVTDCQHYLFDTCLKVRHRSINKSTCLTTVLKFALLILQAGTFTFKMSNKIFTVADKHINISKFKKNKQRATATAQIKTNHHYSVLRRIHSSAYPCLSVSVSNIYAVIVILSQMLCLWIINTHTHTHKWSIGIDCAVLHQQEPQADAAT